MKHVFLALAVLCAAPALAAEKAKPAAADASITPASEAVTMFSRLCIETGGDASRAEKALAPFVKGGVASKLPEDTAKQFVGHDSLASWVIVSPATKQKLMVDYEKAAHCALHVNRADAAQVRPMFKKAVDATAALSKANVAIKTDPKKKVGDHVVRFDFYEIIEAADKPRVAMSLMSSDEPKGDTQHLMSYRIIAPKPKKK